MDRWLLLLLLQMLLRLGVVPCENEVNGKILTEVLKNLGRESLGVEEIQVSRTVSTSERKKYLKVAKIKKENASRSIFLLKRISLSLKTFEKISWH